ncbi:hypothetical protein LX87_02041 [Larkinella arboricola]|uniref:DUF6970 domain-containing protein n=1 Tax=Larkinella arboricola TaxID=643671 RepID=A0A327X3S4_LARAB|nr:hypothetical protein [Larkinella arboricola]RAK00339.1 hypothetical protein LX87_02041 [Larkinella arboricola]
MKTFVSILILTVIIGCQEKNPAPATVPDCIQQVIEKIRQETVWNPPARVYRYEFKGQEVYYIPPRCCDIPSVVIARCDTLCAPDGGFTGKGDGRCPDFAREARNPVLVWEDTRSK